MSYQPETPFDSLDSAFEYIGHLLNSTSEAQGEVETEIARAADPQLARRKQALQLVTYKLEQLSVHVIASRRILNDLRMLRRVLLEERENASGSRGENK
jgi:hypothetical protein